MPKIINPERAEKMARFMKECERAISECPQKSYSQTAVKELKFQIESGSLPWDELFLRYLNDDTLWTFGYHEHLAPFTKGIFQRYFEGVKALRAEIGATL